MGGDVERWAGSATGSVVGLEGLIASINRLAAVGERIAASLEGLGDAPKIRYPVPPVADGFVDEATMAKQLGIPTRTLAKYRRAGKFTGCWVQNGRRVRWTVSRTVQAWKRGIA